jgi:hypothetical protein
MELFHLFPKIVGLDIHVTSMVFLAWCRGLGILFRKDWKKDEDVNVDADNSSSTKSDRGVSSSLKLKRKEKLDLCETSIQQ